jgi:hypothetical protein
MALMNFVDKVGPPVSANWLNSVDLIIQKMSASPGGNISIGAPSSGNTLSLTSIAGQAMLNATDGTITTQLLTTGGQAYIGTTGAFTVNVMTGNTARIATNSSGNVTINAPSSGLPLTVTGLLNSEWMRLVGPTGGSGFLGFNVVAGQVGYILADNSIGTTGYANSMAISSSGGGVAIQLNGTTKVFLAAPTGRALTVADAILISSSVALNNGAGASVGTLTNAPVVGNPSKWIPIVDNGTTRYIPAW